MWMGKMLLAIGRLSPPPEGADLVRCRLEGGLEFSENWSGAGREATGGGGLSVGREEGDGLDGFWKSVGAPAL